MNKRIRCLKNLLEICEDEHLKNLIKSEIDWAVLSQKEERKKLIQLKEYLEHLHTLPFATISEITENEKHLCLIAELLCECEV